MADLKPCPFCGCKDIEYDNSDTGGGQWLQCNGDDCGAKIWISYKKNDLEDKWNRRTGGPNVNNNTEIKDESKSPKSSSRYPVS